MRVITNRRRINYTNGCFFYCKLKTDIIPFGSRNFNLKIGKFETIIYKLISSVQKGVCCLNERFSLPLAEENI